MKPRKRPGLDEEDRQRLDKLVLNRLRAQPAGPKEPSTISAEPERTARDGVMDFQNLPGYQELRLQRSMAAVVGLDNPFFRLHETAAGATTVMDGRRFVNFSSYDYLGLNQHPEVRAAAHAAIDEFGTSASASRVVAGERPGHRTLEQALAEHYQQESCVVFVSGHGANVSTIGALLGPKDLIVHDSLAHNSIVLGATLSRAERRSFPHNDCEALDSLLAAMRDQFDRVLIVVEGLYSMDGDSPDLPRLIEIKRRHEAWLMVDEAHGLGVLGDRGYGLFEQAGADPRDVDIWMGTLSKTLASCGGFIAGSTALVEYLKCMSGGFVYSVGLSPPLAAASATALSILRREPQRVERLTAASRLFLAAARARGLDAGASSGRAIIPILVGNSVAAVAVSQKLFERGVNVQPIIYPAVPERAARLRFFLTSEHTPEQIHLAVDALADSIREIDESDFFRNIMGLAKGDRGL
ncbi:8-amino-7-oxononanoate synthase [Methylocella tundrae]|uniref:8-amino-7-oxononanoate synthase n=1 Tax=Methylocella tundrae TaxID=227605 RepID=A0A8B6M2D2_METTU|nr:aminotransferase class I/II-fold pyridoxal phosphate-dependent enzyme [Methylocella tundrae]VTZ28054.1 8-amino-7-oxononanoate synthase [Methylocella tundrae]VTZ48934.1 8-amino-7-oxononanoate synthase [Methylocella tundrae]